ncbi:MAG: rubredoxin [Candidatus Bipolaricaulota bacterium]
MLLPLHQPMTGSNLEPRTQSDYLPDKWTCPECGTDSSAFELV